MLNKLDFNKSLSKDEYLRRLPYWQNRLYDLQNAVYRENIPVIIVFEGWASAGKGDAIKCVTKRMDARGFRVVPIAPSTEIENNYPWLWRFWQKIPARGQIIIFDTSWYRRVLIDRVDKAVKKKDWRPAFKDISEFENELAADGTVIIKFWLDISKKEQARRFKKLLENKLTAWQVGSEDRQQHRNYKKYREAVEEMLAKTNSRKTPWTVVEAADRHFTRAKVYETVIGSLEKKLGKKTPPKPPLTKDAEKQEVEKQRKK